MVCVTRRGSDVVIHRTAAPPLQKASVLKAHIRIRLLPLFIADEPGVSPSRNN